MKPLRGLCIGAGYFSQFHLDAWRRIGGVEIVAVCDRDAAKAAAAAQEFGISGVETDAERAMDELVPDFVDVITPPPSHLPLVEAAAARGLAVICQKPLAPDLAEAVQVVRIAEAAVRYKVPSVKLVGHDRIDLVGLPKDEAAKLWSELYMTAAE